MAWLLLFLDAESRQGQRTSGKTQIDTAASPDFFPKEYTRAIWQLQESRLAKDGCCRGAGLRGKWEKAHFWQRPVGSQKGKLGLEVTGPSVEAGAGDREISGSRRG